LVALVGALVTVAVGCGADYVERERARRHDPRAEERHEEHHDHYER
jgi:hypothetical protein